MICAGEETRSLSDKVLPRNLFPAAAGAADFTVDRKRCPAITYKIKDINMTTVGVAVVTITRLTLRCVGDWILCFIRC